MHTALITGATGFLGREVAHQLLAARPELHLMALVRARDEAQLAARRARRVEGLGPEQAERLEAVRGDIEQPRLGLSPGEHGRVLERVERMIHVAASVSFDLELAEARRINVGGTEHAIEFCRALRGRGRSGRLDYVGTAYVAGDRTDLVREDELEAGQGFRNTYEQSKYEAEQRCRAAANELPVAIYRPSIIVGDSRTGRTTSYKTIYWPMKLLFRFYGLSRPLLPRLVRLPVRPDCRLDIVPLDFVASSVVALYGREDAVGGCFHVAAGPGAVRVDHLVNLACDHFGVARLGYLATDGAAARLARVARPLMMRAWPRFTRNAELILAYAMQNPEFEVSRARALGIVAPSIEAYYLRLLDFAYGTDFGRKGPAA
jgi:long-chain acyl-CoA synthetase